MSDNSHLEIKTFNFKFIKNFDIEELKQHILNIDEKIWLLNTSRQDLFVRTHKNTQSIFITSMSLEWTSDLKYSIEIMNNLDPLISKKIFDIIYYLENYYNGKVGRSLLIRLNSKSDIPKHTDGNFYLVNVHRTHIPIVTDPKVIFTVGDEKINMKQGDCYEINNSLHHSVINDSDIKRIHLVVDIIPNSMIMNKQ